MDYPQYRIIKIYGLGEPWGVTSDPNPGDQAMGKYVG